LDPELKRAFDGYCGVVQRSQSFVVEALIRNLMTRWRERLQPDDWQRLVRNEMTRAEWRAAYRRAVALRPELVVIENPTIIGAAPADDNFPTSGSAA
jgi:hypothetical protein